MLQPLSLYFRKLTGYYRWEMIHECPVCKSGEFIPHSRHRSGLLSLQLQSCQKCGLIIQSPRMEKESLSKFYMTGYRDNSKIKNDPGHTEKLFHRGMRRGEYIREFLDENSIKYRNSLVVEAGCSYGGILERFREQGCRVRGCDVSPAAVQYGISKGLDLSVGSIDILDDVRGKADILILSHVLEHIAEPHGFLQMAKKLLKPEGILYVEVPGTNNPKVKDNNYAAQIGHLLYFYLDTLRNLLEKNGFEMIFGNEIVQGIFRKI